MPPRAEPRIRVRVLEASDTEPVLRLLRPRPIHNVLLDHVVRAGALGRVPGFVGCEVEGEIRGVLMVGSLGGAALEARSDEVFAPLARGARHLDCPPRHLSGSEDVTQPFWREYSAGLRQPLVWERRERVYVVSRAELPETREPETIVRRAREAQVDELVEHSAQQHVEDLKEDRRAMDPAGFRARHRNEVRDGHWWVVLENGRICFQVHVGPRNDEVVQLGGVFTPQWARGRGHATRGLRALVARLHADRPAVSLFCDEGNAVACRLYERVGFRVRFYNRSYLLKPAEGRYA